MMNTGRSGLLAVLCALVLILTSCTGSETAETEEASPSLAATDGSTPEPTATRLPEPTPMPTLGQPWSSATASDTELADRLLEIWTDNDAGAVEQVYDAASLLVTGWSGVEGGRDAIRDAVAGTPNTYVRVSGVTMTTQPVPGLWALPPGARFLHFVSRIHGSPFDIVLAVTEADRILVHWAYEYEAAGVRLHEGFPPIATPAPATP